MLCALVRFALLLLALPGTIAAEEFQDVSFLARSDQSEQRYVLRLPEGFRPEESRDLLVVLHGHGADRWQFPKDGRDECRGAREAAAKYGMILVSPDYRARTSWMGPRAEEDVVQILEELRRNYRVGKVVVSGGSMGGTSAMTFAALHPELVDGVVSLNGHANHLEYEGFQEAIGASFGGSKVEKPEEYKKRSAEYWPERLTMPVGLTTGGRDSVVPPESTQRLARVLERLKRPVLLIHRPDGGHATNLADTLAAYSFVIEKVRSRDDKAR